MLGVWVSLTVSFKIPFTGPHSPCKQTLLWEHEVLETVMNSVGAPYRPPPPAGVLLHSHSEFCKCCSLGLLPPAFGEEPSVEWEPYPKR